MPITKFQDQTLDKVANLLNSKLKLQRTGIKAVLPKPIKNFFWEKLTKKRLKE